MKKAKIALTAMAVLAVVGGALAYRAANPIKYFKEGIQNQCTVLTFQAVVPSTTGFQTRLSTASTTLRCPLITVTTVQ
ncbi:hypothetical protein CLV51_1021229 [Chitinophaga niastensis]|uniref:Uncharacterized protein n=1 Tax=Chitinophaga niastensis TaxID=536980 RepID=A0A2P8HQ82_CHINA|nr:hypothetical protein [Chitinophaga niastensis]PSL48362.1 hypothetical protein CLV51_1021229 [Chitinophaga niastensis]